MPELRHTANGFTIQNAGVELASAVTVGDAPAFESPRPYLHPIRSLDGCVVTDYRPIDHSWHWGLSVAIANIDVPGEHEPVNLWGGVTYMRGREYVQLENNGEQRHEGFDGDTEQLTWFTARGAPFVSERRRLRATVASSTSWRLDIESEWTNVSTGAVRFGSPATAGRPNAGYGGLFLRGAQDLRGAEVILDG